MDDSERLVHLHKETLSMFHSVCNIVHAWPCSRIHESNLRLERKRVLNDLSDIFETKTYSIRFLCWARYRKCHLVGQHPSRWGAPSGGGWGDFFYNIVSIWYMVSHHHTISSKILYGRKNYNTIEKKIWYGKNFFTITISNNNCKNFLPYYHTIFIAAIFCRPLVPTCTYYCKLSFFVYVISVSKA